jgi:hypothetical protein
MKRNHVTLAVLLAALSFLATPSASAISKSDVQSIQKAVANVPAAELAATAARIISQSSKSDRQEVALTMVREIASKRPATVVTLVAAIAKAAPEVSAAVAAEAAKLSTDQASDIAKAATTSAPAEASKIAAAVAKVVPDSATSVTRSVATLVPDQTVSVKEAVVAAVPTASTSINADATITRLSQRSASGTTVTGVITTRPGTIKGTPPPDAPPSAITTPPVEGSDSRRQYGTP